MDSQQEIPDSSSDNTNPKWSQLSRVQRRIVGVLVEKSKTTPDVYPMTVNAIRAGANQKSNRKPQMELENEEVEDLMLELRHLGAVIEVIGDGRVPKFKHAMYEWLDVDKKELSVMTELLLRGEQTVGDLRARASRMDNIANQDELKGILRSLISKNLLIELTPPGRGQMVTHNLYYPEELEKVRRNLGSELTSSSGKALEQPAVSAVPVARSNDLRELVQRIELLEQQVSQLRQELDEIKS